MIVEVHHPDVGSIEISLGSGRQTFRWLAKAVEARLSVFKTLRTNFHKESTIVGSFKNAAGELLNPFDMIYEHGEEGAKKIEIWADDCSTELEIDENGDPVYPEWLAAAYVMSEEGRKWQNTITTFRDNKTREKDTIGASSTMVQVGAVTDGQGAINAFNIDTANLDYARLGIDKMAVMKMLTEKLRPAYAALCGIFSHFAGPAELGLEYGLTAVEFGRFLHYTSVKNIRLYKDDIDNIFKQVVGTDRVALLMSRSELLQAFLMLDGDGGQNGGPATDITRLGERISDIAEATQKVWSGIFRSHVIYRDEPKLQQALNGYRPLLKRTFQNHAARDSEDASEMSVATFHKVVDSAGVAETINESNKQAAIAGAQFIPAEGWELSTLVFAEFQEAVVRFAISAITTDLSVPEKVRLALEAVTEARSYK